MTSPIPPLPKPTVLIVGAGLGGLMMGALLERIGIPYHIFERATKVKPLGSIMSLGPNITPLFRQLGLEEELLKISLPVPVTNLFDTDMNVIGAMKMDGQKETTGFETVVFARPQLYDLLLKQVPPTNISFGKRVLTTEEKDDKVIIRCSDNSIHTGDILIGADGAYSCVRQHMYKHLDQMGALPQSDTEDLSIGYTLMVGVATPDDPSKYPQLQDPFSHFGSVLGDKRLSWGAYSVPGQICWLLIDQYEDAEEAKKQKFRNSEWTPETNETMIKEFYDQPCPYGGKMGDLIDATPKELISKVYVEEKMFKTWFHGRTVLLGDGAVNAMQDAAILANGFYDLKDLTSESITAMFQDYYDQRFERAKENVENSRLVTRIMGGQTWTDKIIRTIMFNLVPKFIQQREYARRSEYRPQVTFLPLVTNTGTGNVISQKPSWRYTEEQKQKQGNTDQVQAV
ncbi:hypothetical protein BGZ95_007674 [Linnemannia exigua]|uniref:FAD-binding domain-containing protein n=1 Tax=Linnemannia exigua TaxID=604196 RepID=A0AAD4H852_9FUNG|nr:hypothetical protein BGZ95_007674 [Linnemannia exigua]